MVNCTPWLGRMNGREYVLSSFFSESLVSHSSRFRSLDQPVSKFFYGIGYNNGILIKPDVSSCLGVAPSIYRWAFVFESYGIVSALQIIGTIRVTITMGLFVYLCLGTMIHGSYYGSSITFDFVVTSKFLP